MTRVRQLAQLLLCAARAMRFFLGSLLFVMTMTACSEPQVVEVNPAPTPVATPEPVVEEPPAPSQPTPPPNVLATRIDDLFTKAAATGSFSGAVIVVDGNKTVLEKGYGAADRAKKIDVTPSTIFRIGSLTKQLTAAAILSLANEDKLQVTDPVSKYFPEYPKENLSKDGVELTLHHLLSQTSGLPDARKTKYFTDNVWWKPIDPMLLLQAAVSQPLVRKPGVEFEYLNYNYFLLGLVIERASGKPYDVYMRERFFGPLGMADTGSFLPASAQSRAALGYGEKTGTASMADDPKFKDRDITFAFGSGQLYSTVLDLARWDRALSDGTALPAKVRDLLFKPNVEQYGYGWVVEQKNSMEIDWHNGALSPLGFSSYIVRVPSKHRFVAYLSNLDIEHVGAFELKVEGIAVVTPDDTP